MPAVAHETAVTGIETAAAVFAIVVEIDAHVTATRFVGGAAGRLALTPNTGGPERAGIAALTAVFCVRSGVHAARGAQRFLALANRATLLGNALLILGTRVAATATVLGVP